MKTSLHLVAVETSDDGSRDLSLKCQLYSILISQKDFNAMILIFHTDFHYTVMFEGVDFVRYD